MPLLYHDRKGVLRHLESILDISEETHQNQLERFDTPLNTNIAPERWWFEDDLFLLGTLPGMCELFVSGSLIHIKEGFVESYNVIYTNSSFRQSHRTKIHEEAEENIV